MTELLADDDGDDDDYEELRRANAGLRQQLRNIKEFCNTLPGRDPWSADMARWFQIAQGEDVADETVVEALRFLARGRREYYQGPAVRSMQDMEKLSMMDVILLIEYETADKLARIIEDPDSAWGWLPAHQLDAWQPYAEALKRRQVGDVD